MHPISTCGCFRVTLYVKASVKQLSENDSAFLKLREIVITTLTNRGLDLLQPAAAALT
jgi:hypothetical protein